MKDEYVLYEDVSEIFKLYEQLLRLDDENYFRIRNEIIDKRLRLLERIEEF